MRKVIATLTANQNVLDYFLLTHIEICQGSRGSYVDLKLQDASMEINGKIWDVPPPIQEFVNSCKDKLPLIVYLSAKTKAFNGKNQLTIDRIRHIKQEDPVSIDEFIPKAPHPLEYMFDIFKQAIYQIENEAIRTVIFNIYERYKEDMVHCPAAKNMHHDVYSGLIWHTTNMLQLCDTVYKLYSKILNRDILKGACLVHDLDKVREFQLNGNTGIVTDYSTKGKLKGHIVMMSQEIRETAIRLGFDPNADEILLLEHTVLAHHGQLEYGSPVLPRTPEAVALAYIDLLDSRMGGIFGLMEKTEIGNWSEWSRMFEGQVYKHNMLKDDKE